MSTDKPLKPAVPDALHNIVVLGGWVFLGILVLPVVAGLLALSRYLWRFGREAPVVTPSLSGVVSDDLLLLGVLAGAGLIVYAIIQLATMLSIRTFGERATEETREQADETIDDAIDTGEDMSDAAGDADLPN